MIVQLDLMTGAVVIVAFIAGYSVVSFVVRKMRAGSAANDDKRDSSGKDFNPPTDDDRL
jgi:hypothetical protein